MSAKRTRNPKGSSVRLSVYVPVGVAERLEEIARENSESISSTASKLLSENADTHRVMERLNQVLENQDMLLFSMEVLGARMDELSRLMAVRLPSRDGLSEEEKKEVMLKAQKLTQKMAASAAETAMAYRTGETSLDPLGIDQALRKFADDSDDSE